jgi:acetyl-CoA acetyltransferase
VTQGRINLSGRAAVVGVGASSFERDPQRSVIEMAGAALTAALADAGLEKGAIDGLVVQIGSPRGADYDTLAQTFGLDPRYCSQTWPHGRFTSTVIAHAVMAVACGLATRVACLLAMKNSDLGRIGEANNPFFYEQFRENGGPHGEEGHLGMTSPVAGAAMALDLYCRRYGQDRELLAAIPMAFRRHALMNPDAVAKEPLTLEAYRTARSIVDPIRLFDCSMVGDGAVCLIISAKDVVEASQDPVWVTGVQGVQAGRETFIFGARGLGMAQQSQRRLTLEQARSHPVYAMAGVTPDSVDVLGVYDSFSPLALYTFEDFGFCAAGEGLDWIQGGRIELGGDMPTNLNGGQLSHAQVNGWGQVREIILQLRGQAGARQVEGARKALWATIGGDALAFERS